MEGEAILSTPDTTQNPSNVSSTTRFICRVCEKQFSQYTCPRCNTKYCSLPCYKSHSLRCTESFMRENVMEAMKDMRPDDESKKKMLDILKRFHAEDEEGGMDEEGRMDEDEPTLSEETVEKVLSGGEFNFDDLTAEEKKLFRRAMASGELGKMIEPWEPWWFKPSAKTVSLSEEGTRLVQPLAREEASGSSKNDFEQNLETEIPPGPDAPLPPLKKLTSSEPSPLLAIHLVDILYSYCFTLRLHNGDWQSDPLGASLIVLDVSAVLGQGAQPDSMLETVSNCLEQTCSTAFKYTGGLQFGLGLLDDVSSLISLGGAALLCALCDLNMMIKAALEQLKSEKRSYRTQNKNKFKSAERKVYFIMCWVHEQPEEVWSSLAILVKAEKASQLEYRGNVGKPSRTEEKTNSHGKVLIEEV